MTATRWGQTEAAAGAVAAVLIIAATPGLPIWAGYLIVWAPLLLAVGVAARRRTDASGTIRVRLRITWMDALVGAFVGLLLRLTMMAIELFAVGHVSSSSSPFVVDHDAIWVFAAIIAPAIIAPVVEELFFRGLVLPAIGMNWVGVIGSAIIFAAVHLVYGFSPLTALSTFIVGVVLGVLAVRTQRLGAGIVAHIVYNASLIALSEFGGLTSIGG